VANSSVRLVTLSNTSAPTQVCCILIVLISIMMRIRDFFFLWRIFYKFSLCLYIGLLDLWTLPSLSY
jgi:hypothetical protein